MIQKVLKLWPNGYGHHWTFNLFNVIFELLLNAYIVLLFDETMGIVTTSP